MHVGVGLAIFLSSIPLVRRRVPMNHWYGVRIPAAFRSDKDWFAVNEYGGRALMKFATLIIFTSLIGLFVPATALVTYALINAGITVVGLAIVLMRIFTWARRNAS
jgi:hypothetical protein